jgi:signal transduction histidine kinase
LSIRTRLLLLVFAVWLPAAAGFALLAHSTYERETAAAHARIEQLAASVASVLERELDKRTTLARALAASVALQDRDIARFHREAAMAAANTDSWVLLVDRNRQLVNTLLPGPMPLPRSDATPFVVDAPRVFFMPRAPVTERPSLAVFAPVPGKPVAFNVGVSFAPGLVQQVLAEHKLPEGAIGAVLEAGHRVVARSREPEKWIGATATEDVRRRMVQGDSGFAPSVTLEGIPAVTYLTPAGRHGWSVLIALPVATLEASARMLTLQAVTASGVLLLIGLALALWQARSIGVPVLALKDAAADLGANRVPAALATGLAEADAVSAVLRAAGERAQQAERVLHARVDEAVRDAQVAQARLLEAQKHEAIGRLTGGIAHDFNNLLQTISMGLHVIERAVGEGRHARALQAAMGACARAADLVRQMLAFGRTQSLDPQPVALGDFLLKNEELTRKAVGERIVLRADVEPGLPAVQVDPAQLELALLNLIFNARDAMPQGGSITLRARPAAAGDTAALGQGGYVSLQVIDDGPGMDAQTRARAFEPYFTTKPVGRGSGLGLAQVLAFTRQSGGDAQLRSAPGEGTCVTLLLPQATGSAAPAAASAPEPAAPARPLHILMVEDDVLVASVVQPALESHGHQVTLCRSADDAVRVLSAGAAFDVLFTDVVMPGSMSGLDLVAWCARECPALPAVVATGYTAQRAEGDARVLRKPYAMATLLQALQQAGAPPG